MKQRSAKIAAHTLMIVQFTIETQRPEVLGLSVLELPGGRVASFIAIALSEPVIDGRQEQANCNSTT
jgi:hypothetical protein